MSKPQKNSTQARGLERAPLAGVRVLSLENYLAGNHATWLMGMLGAEIIKIEHGTGDVMRGVGPFMEGGDGRRRSAGELRLMTNKRSIVLDMTGSEGLALFRGLVAKVDVFFTNQKPASLLRMGIDFDALQELNPRIVYTTLSGFGHDDVLDAGPFGDWVAFDVIAQGLAGLQFRTSGEGDGPGYNGLPLGDENTSTLAVLGTVSALLRREREGSAQRVDVAMHDAMVFCNELALGTYSLLGMVPQRGRSATSAPYGVFRSSDGWVNIAVGGDPVWRRFCAALDRADLVDDPRFRGSAQRVAHGEDLNRIVGDWVGGRATQEVVATLHAAQVPCAPVFTIAQAAASPQVAARGMMVTVDDPIAGTRQVVGNPIKMNGMDNACPLAPPLLGADTEDVLHELLGLDEREIAGLAGRRVIRLGT